MSVQGKKEDFDGDTQLLMVLTDAFLIKKYYYYWIKHCTEYWPVYCLHSIFHVAESALLIKTNRLYQHSWSINIYKY